MRTERQLYFFSANFFLVPADKRRNFLLVGERNQVSLSFLFSVGNAHTKEKKEPYLPKDEINADRRKIRQFRIFSQSSKCVKAIRRKSRSTGFDLAAENRTLNKFLLSLRARESVDRHRSPIFAHFQIVELDNVTSSRLRERYSTVLILQ